MIEEEKNALLLLDVVAIIHSNGRGAGTIRSVPCLNTSKVFLVPP